MGAVGGYATPGRRVTSSAREVLAAIARDNADNVATAQVAIRLRPRDLLGIFVKRPRRETCGFHFRERPEAGRDYAPR